MRKLTLIKKKSEEERREGEREREREKRERRHEEKQDALGKGLKYSMRIGMRARDLM